MGKPILSQKILLITLLVGYSILCMLRGLVPRTGRARRDTQAVHILLLRMCEGRPRPTSTFNKTLLCSDRGGTRGRQQSSVQKGGDPGSLPLHPKRTPEYGRGGSGRSEKSRDDPGASLLAAWQAHLIG